jgi:hypothetical protein
MRKLAGALLLAFAAACNSDSTSPADGTVVGNYVLQTANGKPVPTIAIQDDQGTFQVVRGRIVLRDNLSFVDTLIFTNTPPGGTPQSGSDIREGTYRQTGNNLTLTFNTTTGFVDYYLTWIDANTLAYAERSLSLIYRK